MASLYHVDIYIYNMFDMLECECIDMCRHVHTLHVYIWLCLHHINDRPVVALSGDCCIGEVCKAFQISMDINMFQ